MIKLGCPKTSSVSLREARCSPHLCVIKQMVLPATIHQFFTQFNSTTICYPGLFIPLSSSENSNLLNSGIP